MSGLDIFAWIVLCILVGSIIAVFCIAAGYLGTLPKTWTFAGAGRDSGRLGHPDLRFCAVAGRADLGLCRLPVARAKE